MTAKSGTAQIPDRQIPDRQILDQRRMPQMSHTTLTPVSHPDFYANLFLAQIFCCANP
jgi:hypothetical protein